jgi:hypothetical protein
MLEPQQLLYKTHHEIRSLLAYSQESLEEIQLQINSYYLRIQVLNSCLQHQEAKMEILAQFIVHQTLTGSQASMQQAHLLTNATKAQIQADTVKIEEELNVMTNSLNLLDFVHQEISEHLLAGKGNG